MMSLAVNWRVIAVMLLFGLVLGTGGCSGGIGGGEEDAGGDRPAGQ